MGMIWYVNPGKRRRKHRRNPAQWRIKTKAKKAAVKRKRIIAVAKAKSVQAKHPEMYWYRRKRVLKKARKLGLLKKSPTRAKYVVKHKGKKLYGAAAQAVLKSKKKAGGKMARKRKRKKLYGAALRAHMRKVYKSKRRRAYKRNPAMWRIKTRASRVAHRKASVRSAVGGSGYSVASWGKVLAKYKTRKKRKSRKGYAAAKAFYRKRRKRSDAGKSRKHKRKGKKSMARKRRKGKRSKASYRKAGRKAARTRAAKKAARRVRRRKGRRVASRGRRVRAPLRTLKRARSVIKGRKRYSRKVRRYISAHRFRVNPGKGFVGAIKSVIPVAAAFFAGRIAVAKAGDLPVVGGLVGKLGQHAPVALSAVVLLAGNFAAGKVRFLGKHRAAVMTGLGLNLVFSAISAYAPASIKGFIGAGDAAVYDDALAGMQFDTAGYEEVDGYETVDGYEETGIEQELGVEQELGAFNAGIPKVARVRALPAVSVVRDVPAWSPASDEDVYTGSFAGGGRGGWGY